MTDEHQVLILLARMEGQIAAQTQLAQQYHDNTSVRINDLRHAIEGRIDGVEKRVGTLEGNERSTAIKAHASGALSGAIVAAAIKALEHLVGR